MRLHEIINVAEANGPFPIPPTTENITKAKAFVLRKWRERAAELGLKEPVDLSMSCKFSSMFAQQVFGGTIRGNYHHQFVVHDDGQIIDLNIDAADVQALSSLAHDHDSKFFGSPDHAESMASCRPRVSRWVHEFSREIMG